MKNLTDDKLDTLRDFKKFAEKFLIIRSKSGEPKHFRFNRAQDYLHGRLEAQRTAVGRVRAVILKGRQQGCSSYIQARFFHRVVTTKGVKAFILTHDKDATKNLFGMAQRFYDNLDKGLVPVPDTANAKELYFRELDSGYSVGTAGNKSVGRSQTVQLMHACIGENTKIFDPITDGLRNIQDFDIGDLVLTHNGNVAPISFISMQYKKCIKVKFRTLTAFPLYATPEHKFWTKEGWKQLSELKSGDSIGFPVFVINYSIKKLPIPLAPIRIQGGGRQYKCPDEIEVNYYLGRILGLYIADGNIKLQDKKPCNPSQVTFIVHRKEIERTLEWLKPLQSYFSSINVKNRKDSLASEVHVFGNRFAQFVKNICGRTNNKHFPYSWADMGDEFNRGLIHGYLSGDGSGNNNERRIMATSIISSISLTLRNICASLGYGWGAISYKEAAIRYNRNEKEAFIFSLCGRGVEKLSLEINKSTPPIKRKIINSLKEFSPTTTEISNGYAWVRIRSIEDVGIKKVYDFEVNHDDHSYCTIHGATHNSEVAFWSYAEDHSKGILQAISSEPGTEIILESTANGIGNYFHQRWLTAMQPDNEYQAIFLPWYWQDEYTFQAENFYLTDEEEYLMSLYSRNGLTKEHLAWRRLKIGEFSKDFDAGREHFNVEYPMNATEAFKNPIHNVFINSKYVERARKNTDVEQNNMLIIGVDVAISDRDRTAIIRRKGRNAYNLERFSNYNTMEIVGRLKRIIHEEHPQKMYIDCIGIGAGVVDRLREMGYECVEGINVARSANDKERFKNLRAEIWAQMREWFMGEMPVQIPDNDELHGELCSLGFKENSQGQLQIESKDELRARGLPSPDGADALSLTFAGGFYGTQGNNAFDTIKLTQREKAMFW